MNVLDPRFKDTEFLIEADSFAQQMLWEKFSKESIIPGRTWELLDWQQDSGTMYEVGRIDKRPICVTFFWVKLNGHRVAFYDVCSQLADYKMVEDWLDKNCNPKYENGRCQARCDANNFHQAYGYITRK